jgi:hypothetical protein
VNEAELQLSGLKFCDDPGTSVHIVDEMSPIQKGLAETVMTVGITTGDTRCAQRYAFTSIFMKSVVPLKCSSTL